MFIFSVAEPLYYEDIFPINHMKWIEIVCRSASEVMSRSKKKKKKKKKKKNV